MTGKAYAMNIDDILEMMDDIVDKSASVPFSKNKVVIDADRMRDLINDVRLNLPQEIKRAKLIDFDCERILKEAEQEAESIVRRAEERAKVIISQEEILKEAKQRAAEVIMQSQAKSKEMRAAIADYVENILGQAENYLQSGLVDVKRTRQAIAATAKNQSKLSQNSGGKNQ